MCLRSNKQKGKKKIYRNLEKLKNYKKMFFLQLSFDFY